MSSVLPGAEPFEHAGGPVGVLLCHGFTGSPQTLRGWAEYLAGQGLTVSLPRLPGHGTTWQEMARTGSDDWLAEVDTAFGKLASQCEQVFVFGLSMGGCLALRLAETRGGAVRGLVLVNPSLAPDTKLFL
ncbi:MAG TPA: alpha/beta fold hydrolase, partial [Streptosporangiaceae bacterium]|nr:alpha/beta fold hydrolase [Streptosporangiaceae bacterium]